MVGSATVPPLSTKASHELERLWFDCRNMTGGKRLRWLTVVFSEAFAIIAFYRLNRAAYLAFGRKWVVFRALTAPLNPLIRIFVPSQIDYRADVGAGLRILHPQLGVVIGEGVRAGKGLILAGGNCVSSGSVVLGNWVELGVNATIVDGVTLGSDVHVGAGAVVVKDFAGPGSLIGVPARPVGSRDEAPDATILDEADFTL